jgi:selenide,water dikinase
MIDPLVALAGGDDRVLVGPGTADDAGAYRLGDRALLATADFITPVCDDPARFGRIAAANALSDIYAMGGEPIFALNLCCFPDRGIPEGVLGEILRGAAETVKEAGAVILGGHTVRDPELKFGLAVVGTADPARILTNAGAREGDRLVLTKSLGTGVLINGFKADKLEEAGLEPALREMERLNATASSLAREHGAHAATDVTGFGLVGHALEMARASGVGMRIESGSLPEHEAFQELVRRGVSTRGTRDNAQHAAAMVRDTVGMDRFLRELLHDPQTSGGLLIAVPAAAAADLVADLVRTGHRAAAIGAVTEAPPGLEVT